jgi:PAS domain S-box-containing protein
MSTETLLFPTILAWVLTGVLMVGMAVLVTFQRRMIAALRRHGGQLEQQLQERAAQAERDLAERHQALESLRESEEKYRTLAEFTYDWEYWIDPDGRYVYVSPACERITGYRPDDFMADPNLLLNLVHPEDRDRVAAHHFGDRNPHEILDFRLIARNGKQIWIGHVCQAVHGCDGRYLGQRGSNRDITARKQAETALRISEERYRQIVETAHEGIWAVDAEQRTTFVNWRMMDLLGYAPEEMFGQRFESFLFAEDLDAHRAQRERRFQGENSVYERRFRRKDGQILWTAVSAVALRDLDGQVIGSFAMLADITDRKRAEEALRESETLLRDVLDSLSAHIAVLDAHGTVLLVNNAWRRFAEQNDGADRLVGVGANYLTACQSAIEQGDTLAQAALQGIRAVMNGEQPVFGLEYPCHSPTESRWFSMRVHALSGIRPGVVIAHEDITERRRAEKALRSALKERETLLREVHHRVKNNLAAIIGLLDLQRDALDDASLAAALDELAGRIRSMALVHEMLYQSGPLNRIEFQDYLQALLGHLQGIFDLRGAVRIELAAFGVWMNLDTAIPCGLIITELVSNAFKYAFLKERSGAGPDDRLVKVSALQDDEVHYTVTVTDNGVGLPADLDWTTTPSLGLRLVRMLGQHQLGGTLELDRTTGTCFSLRFTTQPRDRSVEP